MFSTAVSNQYADLKKNSVMPIFLKVQKRDFLTVKKFGITEFFLNLHIDCL